MAQSLTMESTTMVSISGLLGVICFAELLQDLEFISVPFTEAN